MPVTSAEMSSVFEVAWRMMPMPMPASPLARRIDSPGAGPSETCATSPSRVSPRRISASNASGVVTGAVVRTKIDWARVCSAPAGTSKATSRRRRGYRRG
jgi:hypothetical protein